MANKPLKSIKFPGLSDTYTVPQIDDTLAFAGKAADAKKTGDELANKANQDGYYSDMTAGNAEQIVATKGAFENTPYIFRKTGGGVSVNDRVAEELVGGTVAWNQVVVPGSVASRSQTLGITISANTTTGEITVSGTATATNNLWFVNNFEDIIGNGHVFLLRGSKSSTHGLCLPNTSIKDTGTGIVFKTTASAAYQLAYYFTQGDVINETLHPEVFDLTQMFGSTIADYIYSLETSHAGDGVAFFRSLFPKDYYAYDAGSLQSVQAAKHITTGFNQWDEEWEVGGISNTTGENGDSSDRIRSKNYIPVLPNTGYYYKSTNAIGMRYYDESKNYIGYDTGANVVRNTPANCYYLRFIVLNQTTYNNDICINLSNPSRNGEYEPYAGHEYPLGEVTLRGIPKLEDGKLYYDGDTYKSDGTVTRKYGFITLDGTENWIQGSSDVNLFYCSITRTNIPYSITGEMLAYSNYPFKGYVASGYSSFIGNANGFCAFKPNSGTPTTSEIAFKDLSVSTLANWKAKLAASPLTIAYELATPATETSDTFTSPQVVDGAGTELYTEFGTRDVEVPVGHNSVYAVDLRAKLENAPDNPASDGTYLVKHENGENTYVHTDVFDENGAYGNLTAGNAEQLVSSIGEEDKVPYNFRTAGGAIDIGDRLAEKIVGGTVVWNQLIPTDHKSFTYTAAADGQNYNQILVNDMNVPVVAGHKMFTMAKVTRTIASNNAVKIGLRSPDSVAACVLVLENGDADGYVGAIDQVPNNVTSLKSITANNYYGKRGYNTGDTVSFDNLVVFDLTQMFGSTIADYIYGLEQANAGAGVAWFKKLFPKPYYPYNAGELMSVKTSAHKTTGFNQWDEEWENGYYNVSTGAYVADNARFASKNFNPIIPGAKYYFTCTKPGISSLLMEILYYDADKNYTGLHNDVYANSTYHNPFVVPAGVAYFKFYMVGSYGSTYNHDICINLAWDNSRNGEYEPYEENVYPLDSDLELRGIPKLDSGNNLYYDGDTYESDGTVNRRYVVVDLGQLNWGKYDDSRLTVGYYFSTTLPDMKDYSMNVLPQKYTYDGLHLGLTNIIAANGAGIDKMLFRFNTKNIGIVDSAYADTASLVASLSGVYLICELATPTTESADPYQNPQIVNDFGTEEYVDERIVAIPVGHESFYAANLKAKLEMAPDSPDGNGDYIVRQTNGVNEYVPLVIPNELPDVPGTDGTYVLRCTVNNGTATYSWVSAT